MKKIILGAFILISSFAFSQKNYKIDTIYYDNDWKGVPEKVFANYYRIILIPQDTNCKKIFKDYYSTGELQGEGNYIYIDKSDDRKSIFDGECLNYYKSGKLANMGYYNNGKKDGKYIEYYEDGLIRRCANFIDGKLEGLYTEFSEDNICTKIEYCNDIPINNYYTLIDQNGFSSNYDLETDTVIYSIPNHIQMKDNDNGWFYYDVNNIKVAVCPQKGDYYGKQYRFLITIENLSLNKIHFDPNISKAAIIKKESPINLTVYSAEEYVEKIKRKQNLLMGLYGFTSGLAAAQAGTQTSTTNTTTTYNGNSNINGNINVHGSGGSAYGVFSINNKYSGIENSTSVTTTYDSSAAFQAQMIANQNMRYYNNGFTSQAEKAYEEYLKPTTLNSGQGISGYITTQYSKGDKLSLILYINNIPYHFSWDF